MTFLRSQTLTDYERRYRVYICVATLGPVGGVTMAIKFETLIQIGDMQSKHLRGRV